MWSWLPVLATVGILVSSTPLAANSVCKPALTIKEVALSSPVNLRRYWAATVVADASSCTSRSGLFALGFVRLRPNLVSLSRSSGMRARQESGSNSGPMKR